MDKLFFYSKSKDIDAGKGVNEFVENPSLYDKLNKIKDWRKKLSNFWPSEMEIDGMKWHTVEHYYHAMKFMRDFPDFAFTFSLDSDSEWCRDPVMAKSIGGKTGKYKGKNYRKKNIVMREDFYDDFHHEIMEKALYNKFSQNQSLFELLLATNNAQLLHRTRGKPMSRVHDLEKVRNRFKKEMQ